MSSNAIKLDGLNLTIESDGPINPTKYKSYLDELIEVNKLPLNPGNYYFSDDVWDFSPYKIINISPSKLKFDFSQCCETFRNELKKYVFLKLLERQIKIQTISYHCLRLSAFFNQAEAKGVFAVADITPSFLSTYLQSLTTNYSYSTSTEHRATIKSFYTYYSIYYVDLLTNDVLAIFNDIDYKLQKAERKNGKTSDIPQDYYNKFLSATIQIVDDKNAPEDTRSMAAFMLILSQTGLRINECLALETKSMESVSIFNGEIAYYLKYKTWKRVKGSNKYDYAKTAVNPLVKKGYDFLIAFYKKERKQLNTDVLFLGPKNKIKHMPMESNRFYTHQDLYFIYLNNYFPTINLPDGTYKNIKNKHFDGERWKEFKSVQTIAMPTTHQFRVHVCTDLYNKGVPLKYIEKFMSHLSHEMADYYIRPTKQNSQENMDFTLNTLKKIVAGETKLLGGNNGLQTKINEFIEKNNYNVETDLQAICEKLAENIPIRQKTGGVCIKSSMLRECSKDSKTNEFYCAYGVCPNIFHFYYMADVSYRQAKELSETIEINRERGLLKQVQKETNMLHTIVKVKLIPELDELKNVVEKKGMQAVLMEYPDLKDIVENLDEIYKEAAVWTTLK